MLMMPTATLLDVTADKIGKGKPYGLGADFEMGRHGAVTIIDGRHNEEGRHHPIAYLPAGACLNFSDGVAILEAWLAGDRQPWTEQQTAEFAASLRAAA